MFKRIAYVLAVVGALAIGAGWPSTASADWDHHHHHGHRGHWHGHHHGGWYDHGDWHGHWHHRPIVYPPIYYGGYYPVRTYYGSPYYSPYGDFGYYGGPYYGYYGSGVRVSVGW